jgi:hypothetical protein
MLLSRDETEGEKKDDECWEVGGSSFASLAAWCHKCRPYSLRPENNDKGFQQRRKPLSSATVSEESRGVGGIPSSEAITEL